MAQAMQPRTKPQTTGSLFASDHRSHPLQDILLWVTAVLGVLAFVSAMFHNLHLLSSWAGLIGILTGLYSQFVSVTTHERFATLMGLGSAAVGFYLGMAHGGLFGGVLG